MRPLSASPQRKRQWAKLGKVTMPSRPTLSISSITLSGRRTACRACVISTTSNMPSSKLSRPWVSRFCSEQNLDTQGLDNFDDGMFDVVLMTQALQAVRRPDRVIEEMLRGGREGIVTFPNFAHWRLRWGLALSGRMPESNALPYKWYNTPNIRLCTFRDFEALCRQKGIRIKSRRVVDGQHQNSWLARLWPNLLGEIAIYRITRENP